MAPWSPYNTFKECAINPMRRHKALVARHLARILRENTLGKSPERAPSSRVMESRIQIAEAKLRATPKRWLVTGAAGFIGSHIVDRLLELGQQVIGVDNLATGTHANLAIAHSAAYRGQFKFVKGDVTDTYLCHELCSDVDYVLHQAGLGSVPRSLENPSNTHFANVTGTLHLLSAAKDHEVKRVVFASSSSVYGSDENLPKVESRIGRPLSPYAAGKAMCETYASVFWDCYRLSIVGLRYFNVFGPRQDPAGAYAAVMPRWFDALSGGRRCTINGDGSTSRDFCYVANVVQANILAAMAEHPAIGFQAFNVACGATTSLADLHDKIRALCGEHDSGVLAAQPNFLPFRKGDILHSQADISKAKEMLGYEPTHSIDDGLRLTADWYASRQHQATA